MRAGPGVPLGLAVSLVLGCAPATPQSTGRAAPVSSPAAPGTGAFTYASDLSAAAIDRPILVILTDIGGDPDDMQSLRRLLLYANEFRIAGLIASASGIPNELDEAITRPELIHDIVDDYAMDYPTLRGHDERYPHPDSLRGRVRSGSPLRGPSHIGAGRSTPGSDHIITVVDAASREDPVRICIWGGAHDLAQALYDVRSTRDAEQLTSFLSRLRVYAIGDQDAWGDEQGTGAWIFDNFPSLQYVEAGPPLMNRYSALFRGMYQNDSRLPGEPAYPLVEDSVVPLVLSEWVDANVRVGHGMLGRGYPLTNQNPSAPRNGRGVKEGDTPSWFYFLPNGLSDPDQPTYGGWGGRFTPRAAARYVDAEDEHWSGSADSAVRRKWTVARWREAYQHDFAARMDRTVRPFSRVNHNPVGVIEADSTRRVLVQAVRAGESVPIDARGSHDPDGDQLEYRWWIYGDVSDYSGMVTLDGADEAEVVVRVPADAAGQELHLILEVTDRGEPRLTGYRRVVLRVEDREAARQR